MISAICMPRPHSQWSRLGQCPEEATVSEFRVYEGEPQHCTYVTLESAAPVLALHFHAWRSSSVSQYW